MFVFYFFKRTPPSVVSIGTQVFESMRFGQNPLHKKFYVSNRYFSDIDRFWAPFVTSLRLLRLLLRHSCETFIFVGPPMQNGHFGGLETSISLHNLYVLFFYISYPIYTSKYNFLSFLGSLNLLDCFWSILTFLNIKSWYLRVDPKQSFHATRQV